MVGEKFEFHLSEMAEIAFKIVYHVYGDPGMVKKYFSEPKITIRPDPTSNSLAFR